MTGFGSGAWGRAPWGSSALVDEITVRDSLTLSENLSAYVSKATGVSDSLTLSENLVASASLGVDVSDTLILIDGLVRGDPYFSVAQSRRKVELIFSVDMRQDSAFTDPTNYTVEDLNGSSVSVISSTALSSTRIVLELGSDLKPGGYYVSTVNSNVRTEEGYILSPLSKVFQWKEMQAPLRVSPLVIPISNFSGEVADGLLGQPAGQLFFSPALEQSAADSTIQVDNASVCTRAYDEYSFPELADPSPLFTFASGAPESLLNQNSLWTTAERQGLARINLSNDFEDTTVTPVDGPAIATLEEPVDYSRAGFLNDYEILLKGDPPTIRSHLYDGTGKTFICADNLTPVGPGTSVESVLEGYGFSEVLGLSESLTVS